MLKPLLLLLITDVSLDSLEIQTIDINNAKYEELNSIPFFTEEDIKKILKQRPYNSFNEFAESLKLSSIEREILRNYIFISKKEKKFINFIISFNYDSILNYKFRANLKYKEFSLKFSENYFLLGYQNFYFGNFYISKGLGLISRAYFKNSINNGFYFYNNLALFLKFKNFPQQNSTKSVFQYPKQIPNDDRSGSTDKSVPSPGYLRIQNNINHHNNPRNKTD